MKTQHLISLTFILLTIVTTPANSGQITYPNDSYTSGDTLTASDLNNKFNEIKTQVNNIDALKPIAFGKVLSAGTLGFGANNITGVSWNIGLSRYEIDITGVYYSIGNKTTATLAGDAGSCPGGASVRQSSVGGLLLIMVVDKNNAKIQCSFDFVSYK